MSNETADIIEITWKGPLKEIISQNDLYLVNLSSKNMFLKTKWLSISQFD